MKHLISINELFDVDSKSNATVIKSQLNNNEFPFSTKMDILIKDIEYRFLTQLRKVDDEYYIHIGFYIKRDNVYDKFNRIINNSMTISVLNSLSVFLEEYKKVLLSINQNILIRGFYYDVDEDRRKLIYEYFFKKKLKDNLESIEKGSLYFMYVKFKEPILLKNLYI